MENETLTIRVVYSIHSNLIGDLEQESGFSSTLDDMPVLSQGVIKASFSSGQRAANLSNTLTEQSLARQTCIYRCEMLRNVQLHGCQSGLLHCNAMHT